MALLSVSQAANNIIQLVGSVEGILASFPATNADGSSNVAAQNQAIVDTVNSLVSSGLFPLPAGVTLSQIQAFAPLLVKLIANYKLATQKTEL